MILEAESKLLDSSELAPLRFSGRAVKKFASTRLVVSLRHAEENRVPTHPHPLSPPRLRYLADAAIAVTTHLAPDHYKIHYKLLIQR